MVSVGRIRRLRRHPTLLQPMMALRLSGLQTTTNNRRKKRRFSASLFWNIGTEDGT
ncbi:hypothetical protein QE99_002315 [Salmonella enterica subsp. enterica]|nr:hypothetical protein [Salmonella enterica subsp. enterica]